MDAHPYPRLAPELCRLSGDGLLLWGDADARAAALLDILAAWDRSDAGALERAVHRVDAAVVAGLQVLGLPRQPGIRVQVDALGRHWLGRVAGDGTVMIDLEHMRRHLAAGGAPDRVFHTWVHESLHGRRPASPGRHWESARWAGYEEGLAEGLGRIVTLTKAAMIAGALPYDWYVAAYQALARAAGTEAERLWRTLWECQPGEVREGLGGAVDALRQARGEGPLARRQLAQLTVVGDRVFGTDRASDRPTAAVLVRLWETVFR